MNNFVPPFIEGRQLELLIKAIVDLWEAGVLKKYDELFEQLSAAMSSAVQRESPISQPVSFQSHEPPVSDKYNRFFINAHRDLAIVGKELDVLRAWANACFNYTSDATSSLENMLGGIQEHYKTALALCASDGFGLDKIFANCSYVYKQNWESFGGGSTCLDDSGALLLTASGIDNEDVPITWTVLDGNGFAGDLHRGLLQTVEGTNEKTVTFYYTITGKHDSLAALADNNPLTWFEWESIILTPAAQKTTRGWNTEYVVEGGTQSWAEGPEGGALFVDLLGEYEEAISINNISLLPFIRNCSRDNTKISQKQVPKLEMIDISSDGTNWTSLNPDTLYLTSSSNLTEVLPGTEVQYKEHPTWSFESQLVKYIRIRLSVAQPQSNVDIGHFFYVDLDTEERIVGPNPSLDNPTELDSDAVDTVNKRMRRLELLDGKRWSIGVKDISTGRLEYVENGQATSADFSSQREIDRLTLTVEDEMPEGTSLSYHISADGGKVWSEILPVNKERVGEYDPPTVLVFNNHYPAELRDSAYTEYVETVGAADTLKFRVGLATGLNNTDVMKSPRLINYIINVVYKGDL